MLHVMYKYFPSADLDGWPQNGISPAFGQKNHCIRGTHAEGLCQALCVELCITGTKLLIPISHQNWQEVRLPDPLQVHIPPVHRRIHRFSLCMGQCIPSIQRLLRPWPTEMSGVRIIRILQVC